MTSCGNRTGSVFLNVFNLMARPPLDSTRILRPRISRGRDAEYPRGINVPRPERWPFHDHGQVANSPRTRFVRVREQSMSANSPRTQARSHPGRIREHVHASNSPRTGISRGHTLSANFPQTFRILELSTSSFSPRFLTRYDPTLASERTCRLGLVSAARALKFSMPTCTIPAHVRL